MKNDMIGDWELERFLLGELPKRRMKELEARLASEKSERLRLEALRDSNRDILHCYPSEKAVPRILSGVWAQKESREKPAPPLPAISRRRPFTQAAAVLAFAVMAVAGFVIIRNIISSGSLPQEGSRIKGSGGINLETTRLFVYKKNSGGVEALENGSSAKPGDLLQMAYVAGPASHGMVFSIDGKGVVTLHCPDSPAGPTLLERRKIIYLPHAYELDDAPDFERFFFLASDKELNVAAFLEKARELAREPLKAKKEDLNLPGDVLQQSLLIVKGAVR